MPWVQASVAILEQELGWTTGAQSGESAGSCVLACRNSLKSWNGIAKPLNCPKGQFIWQKMRACRNQMYQLGKNVLGFQFHPEITPETLALFLENEEELAQFSGKYVQNLFELKNTTKQKFIEGNQILNQCN